MGPGVDAGEGEVTFWLPILPGYLAYLALQRVERL